MESKRSKIKDAPTTEISPVLMSVNAKEIPSPDAPQFLNCFAASHTGLVRENNEDLFHYDGVRGILIVIDGMGGHSSGEKAASIALQTLLTHLEQPAENTAESIRQAITHTNNEIYLQAQAKPEWRGMGCVLTVVVVENDTLTIGHVGDTRLYLISGNNIKKITPDHSPVGELEDACLISEIEAIRHPKRNEVFRDVGTEKHFPDDEDFVEILQCAFPHGAGLLLCSDGLSDLITSAQMLDIANQFSEKPEKIVENLIAAALDAGGKDNVTAIFAVRAKANSEIIRNKNTIASREEFNAKISGKIFLKKIAVLSKIAFGRFAHFAFGVLTAALIFGLWLYYSRPMPPETNAPATILPRVLFVDKYEPGAYRTISDALTAAASHDTILVSPGQYEETVNLRNGVTLVSQDLRRAVIRPLRQSETGEYIAVLAANIREGRIIGFKIEGGESNLLDVGLKITGGEVEVSDLEITGARVAAIEIGGNAGGTLRSNLLQDNAGIGIVIRDQAAPHLLHNIIRGNGLNAKKRGAEILGAAHPTLLGNVLLDNGEDEIGGLSPEFAEALRQENIIGRRIAERPKLELRSNKSPVREKR